MMTDEARDATTGDEDRLPWLEAVEDGDEGQGPPIAKLIGAIVIGLIAGALARLVVPGKQDISIVMTIVLGIVGSFVGGFLGYLLFRKDAQDGFFQPSGIIGAFIGAVIVLVIWMSVSRRRSVHH